MRRAARPVSTYDRIGVGYASTRQADPRIAAQVHAALAGMRSVVDVGAGAGSYEPPETVLAVEPSAVMLAQRPAGAAPCVRGVAESLPLPDRCVDAALAVLTVHHWSDVAAGVAQLRRVAARRVVVLTWDQDVFDDFWLVRDYLPAGGAVSAADAVPMATLLGLLPGARVERVLVPHDCTDGFGAAFWRRPEAYLDPAVRAGISLLAKADPTLLADGLQRLARDVGSGAREHAELVDRASYDAGYRLVVAEL